MPARCDLPARPLRDPPRGAQLLLTRSDTSASGAFRQYSAVAAFAFAKKIVLKKYALSFAPSWLFFMPIFPANFVLAPLNTSASGAL